LVYRMTADSIIRWNDGPSKVPLRWGRFRGGRMMRPPTKAALRAHRNVADLAVEVGTIFGLHRLEAGRHAPHNWSISVALRQVGNTCAAASRTP
jgi:hypothetical protein